LIESFIIFFSVVNVKSTRQDPRNTDLLAMKAMKAIVERFCDEFTKIHERTMRF
jgi:hypothetical protein